MPSNRCKDYRKIGGRRVTKTRVTKIILEIETHTNNPEFKSHTVDEIKNRYSKHIKSIETSWLEEEE